MLRYVTLALLVVGSLACSHAPSTLRVIEARTEVAALGADVSVDAFEAASFRASNGVELPYRLLRPPADGRPYPLVVIFHGSGAIGTDNRSQIGPVAKNWASDAVRRAYPAYVLVPQMPSRSADYVDDATIGRRSVGTETLTATLDLVEMVRGRERVDRLYAIGFSMGGSAVWNALRWKPGLFSAVVIVAGVPNPDALALLGNTRVLLVHGDADTENPFAAAWATYQLAPRKLELWRFRGVEHEFPRQLIGTTELAEWLHRER
ncbi:MAG TPA: alpha/beta hydrolase-fold protein [Thermoanaerobaculia bacterium]|jgi:predicted peptidase